MDLIWVYPGAHGEVTLATLEFSKLNRGGLGKAVTIFFILPLNGGDQDATHVKQDCANLVESMNWNKQSVVNLILHSTRGLSLTCRCHRQPSTSCTNINRTLCFKVIPHKWQGSKSDFQNSSFGFPSVVKTKYLQKYTGYPPIISNYNDH